MPERASALDLGRRNAGAVTLGERQGLALVQVAAFPDEETAVRAAMTAALRLQPPALPNTAASSAATTILWLGPQRWLVVRRGAAARGWETRVRAAGAALTELSHARTVVRVSGPHARDALAKGCLLDLHPMVFAAGRCAQTTIAHTRVLLHAAVNDPAIDLYVPRSYAQHFWEWLTDAAGEFGYTVAAF